MNEEENTKEENEEITEQILNKVFKDLLIEMVERGK